MTKKWVLKLGSGGKGKEIVINGVDEKGNFPIDGDASFEMTEAGALEEAKKRISKIRCYLVGSKRMVIFDAGSVNDTDKVERQNHLIAAVELLREAEKVCFGTSPDSSDLIVGEKIREYFRVRGWDSDKKQ